MTYLSGGFDRIHLASVDSTNAEGFRRHQDGAGPLWILADEQTAGKGRRNRIWHGHRGNFYATLVQNLDETPQRLGLRSFVASLALYDALVALTGEPAIFALKWPNDVLLNNGKLSGILLESSGGRLAIGIGVNLAGAPPPEQVAPGAFRPVSLLQETGIRILPEIFLDNLIPSMAQWESTLSCEGFPPVRDAFMRRAAHRGEVIRARTGEGQHEGVFEGIDDRGNLLLATAQGQLTIPAADVFF